MTVTNKLYTLSKFCPTLIIFEQFQLLSPRKFEFKITYLLIIKINAMIKRISMRSNLEKKGVKHSFVITLFTLLLIGTSSGVQGQKFDWVGTSTGSGNSKLLHVHGFAAGECMGVGSFDDGVDCEGVILPSTGDTSGLWIQASQQSQGFVSAFPLTGSDDVIINKSYYDPLSASMYFIGSFKGTIDVDPMPSTFNLTSNGGFDAFICKYTFSGGSLNVDWAVSLGGALNDEGYNFYISSGEVYAIGYFNGTVDLDPGASVTTETSAGQDDVFVLKLDASGNFVWGKSFGGTLQDRAFGITSDLSNNLLISGYFTGTADLAPGTSTTNFTSAGGKDVFILKIAMSNASYLDAKVFGGVGDDVAFEVIYLANNNLVTTGSFKNTVDFDPDAGVENHISNGFSDIFVFAMDAGSGGGLGGFSWVKTMGGIGYDNSYSLHQASWYGDEIYIAGYFSETIVPGPNYSLTSNGDYDILVSCLDATDGSHIYSRNIGGIGNDLARSISVVDTTIFLAGQFQDVVDFDPSPGISNKTSGGGDDGFMMQMTMCAALTYGTDVITACGSYTWIDGVTYTSDNNTAKYTLVNSRGCDSIVSLDLTVNPSVDVSVTQIAEDLMANANGVGYQWLDCDNNYAVISGETNQTFSPTISGNYAVEITSNGCTDTSACYSITNVGIEEMIKKVIIIYPNPSKGTFAIDYPKELIGTPVKIVNTLGEEIIHSVFPEDRLSMSLNIKPGVYFMITALGSKRIVIEK